MTGQASPDAVRAVAIRLLETYGLDPADVTGLALDLNSYGIQELHVRLVITPSALAALQATP